MNRRQIGSAYEKQAAEYLRQQGYQIKEQNYRSRIGEIDIIAEDGEYLCFVEVKYRSSARFGSGFDAVDYRKQKRIQRTARDYLFQKGYHEWTPCRFDVVVIEGGHIALLRNAFEG